MEWKSEWLWKANNYIKNTSIVADVSMVKSHTIMLMTEYPLRQHADLPKKELSLLKE